METINFKASYTKALKKVEKYVQGLDDKGLNTKVAKVYQLLEQSEYKAMRAELEGVLAIIETTYKTDEIKSAIKELEFLHLTFR